MLTAKDKKLCSCGRTIPSRTNSTIQNKRCPNCELKYHTGNKKIVAKNKPLEPKAKRKAKSLAMDRADRYFSQYIRLKHCKIIDGQEPICKCIVTGRFKSIKKIDNGHYYSRKYLATRYHEDNCRPQNKSSNQWRGEADHEKFGENLLKEIGEQRFNVLIEIHNNPIPATEEHFDFIARYYRNKVNEIVRQLGIVNPFRSKT